ncbi:hypothetical protein [Streptomyces griseocarneus]|uniref:hypothetical protein n=1 Tax=Streptomyces griseocarneus TaxID=51201 RepID=UPI00167D5FF8|nr:hypothetical protein [Streptomyces griseocarneus]MBZ6476694.1 hypothetical protein [Streptomyces griseocarneus]GHG80382.1 hypothetical protein GCM10018779_61900 [Streptomyces griseocarneus]
MTTATRARRVPVDRTTALAPLDVEAVRATVHKILKPAHRAVLDADDIKTTIADLTAHLGVLMPIAAGRHPALVASVGRRLEYDPPDAARYPVCARRWAEESARSADQLLGLATAHAKPRSRNAGVAGR